MRLCEPEQEFEAAAPRVFATTRWSVLMEAGEGGSEPSRRALDTLCDAYWHPIYVYVLRKGYGPDDAKDLTQEFFAQFIAKEQLRLADRAKGRFRSFLLAALNFFLAREWSRAHRQKRGGQYQLVSLNQESEDSFPIDPAHGDTPEKQFERQWARTVLQQTMNALEEECDAAGKAELFRTVKHLLSGERDGAAYAAIGTVLAKTESTVRVAVHRLRQRYGELLRVEVAQTVGEQIDVDEELRDLLRALTN